MKDLRPVEYSKKTFDEKTGALIDVKIKALFHKLSTSYGPVYNPKTKETEYRQLEFAIIELKDGTLDRVSIRAIRFLDKDIE